MRRVILAVTLAAMPLVASADTAQPITLSGDEYMALVNELAQRDPVMKLLLDKEKAAQQQATQAPAPAASKPDGAAR
jgi:hypothetical protein